jgi:hypothetical protein
MSRVQFSHVPVSDTEGFGLPPALKAKVLHPSVSDCLRRTCPSARRTDMANGAIDMSGGDR